MYTEVKSDGGSSLTPMNTVIACERREGRDSLFSLCR